MRLVAVCLQIWGEVTITGDAQIEFSHNWHPPHFGNEPAAIEAFIAKNELAAAA